MPAFLEQKLRAEYGNNPHAIYGTMNAIGAMQGNKETAKGREIEEKHMEKEKGAANVRRIEIHPADNGGHTVETHFHPRKTKSAAFSEHEEPKKAVFGADEHEKMMSHVAEHLGIGDGDGEKDGEQEE